MFNPERDGLISHSPIFSVLLLCSHYRQSGSALHSCTPEFSTLSHSFNIMFQRKFFFFTFVNQFTWNPACNSIHPRWKGCPLMLLGDNFLPNFSTAETVGWLELGADWEHFTRSAQLGPGWESRDAVSVGGGPLKKKKYMHWLDENKQKHLRPVKPLVSADGTILLLF